MFAHGLLVMTLVGFDMNGAFWTFAARAVDGNCNLMKRPLRTDEVARSDMIALFWNVAKRHTKNYNDFLLRDQLPSSFIHYESLRVLDFEICDFVLGKRVERGGFKLLKRTTRFCRCLVSK